MKAFFRSFFASFLSIIVLLAIVIGVIAWKSGRKSKIEDHSFLIVDVYGNVPEYDPPAGVMSQIIGGEPETLQRILSSLEKASVDKRIDGVIMKFSSTNNAGFAKLQEIRGAIKKVQKAGKKVYGFSDSIDRKTYFLASACDSIFMPPSAYIGFQGISITTQHIKGSLEKLGIKPNIHRIKDYKSAAEMILRKDMSSEARENREWMLEEYWEMFTQTFKEERGLTEDKIDELMKHALFTAEEAKESGLIDHIFYWDELENMLKQENNKEFHTVSQSRYAQVNPRRLGLKGKKKIAVVHAQGLIGGRKSRVDPLLGMVMGHETVVADLRRARLNENIAAVIFRVDSSGGEGLASDLIGHEVEVTSKVKPVVVSMVDVAASGGYAISYRASKIAADPMTVTGSIGSISGKFNMKGLYDKLGMTYDFATKGPMALLFSDYRDFSKEEWERFRENHWDSFNAWLKDIAEHRGMTFEEAEKLAHGRVWTGRQARANGLIDEVGGLDRALEVAKELAGIPADEKVALIHYPKKKGLPGLIFGGSGDLGNPVRWIIYKFIQEDLAETRRLLTEESLWIMNNITFE